MPGPRDEHTLPAVHALHLAEVVKRWDVTADELFAPSGLREDALSDPDARLPLPTVVDLVERARRLTGEPAIGIFLGLQMRISAHGYLGFAAMTSPTARDALAIACRFAPTRTSALGLGVHVESGQASIVLEERADFGPARDAILFALVIGIWQIGQAVTGRDLRGSADLAFPEPPYFHRFARLGPGVRFGQPVNQLVFDASVLDLPLTMADPASRRLAFEQLERSLDALGAGGDVLDRVRTLVADGDRGFRSLEEVASAMHVSPRTLKRKLAAGGVTFSDVLEEQRRERAMLLLRTQGLSLDAIADQLGYSDAANFSRAFRRWTGMSPGAYRASTR